MGDRWPRGCNAFFDEGVLVFREGELPCKCWNPGPPEHTGVMDISRCLTCGVLLASEPTPEPPRSISDAVREKMQFTMANRERLVEAWVAETGLQPSESVLNEQHMDDGITRVWVESRLRGEAAERHLRALVALIAEFGEDPSALPAVLQEPLEAAQDWLETSPGAPPIPAAARLADLVQHQEGKKTNWVVVPIEDAKEVLAAGSR